MKKILREVPAKPKASNTVLELWAVNRGLNKRLFGISRGFFWGGWRSCKAAALDEKYKWDNKGRGLQCFCPEPVMP